MKRLWFSGGFWIGMTWMRKGEMGRLSPVVQLRKLVLGFVWECFRIKHYNSLQPLLVMFANNMLNIKKEKNHRTIFQVVKKRWTILLRDNSGWLIRFLWFTQIPGTTFKRSVKINIRWKKTPSRKFPKIVIISTRKSIVKKKIYVWKVKAFVIVLTLKKKKCMY